MPSAGDEEESARQAGAGEGGAGRRVAFVSGANKGIGKEIARKLAAAGLTVVVGSQSVELGEAAAAEIAQESTATASGASPSLFRISDRAKFSLCARSGLPTAGRPEYLDGG